MVFKSAPKHSYKGKRKFDCKKADDSASPSNKKRALKQARQSHRPHSEVVISAKELWNKLRVKTNSAEDIEVMMKELMELLQGKFNRIALQHDASRVVQSAIQFGNKQQRSEIVTELAEAGNIVELAKSQYSHFVVLKMIKYCKDEKSVQMLVKAFKGQINKLAVHAVGARVIELLFATLPNKSTMKLKLEVYGPRFKIFSDTLSNTSSHPTLNTIIKDQPTGKAAALESLLSIINKGIEKGLFSFAYFQELICEYVTAAPSSDVRSLCSSLVDHSIHLLSTKPGSRVVAECAAYGTPKDRKRIMKSLKGYTRSSLLHSDAYIAILRLLDVTDDTVTAQKSVLTELQVFQEEKKKTVGPPESDDDGKDKSGNENKSPILDVALSATASKLLLLLLAKDDEARQKYFDPAELEILRSNPTIFQGGEEVPTSKKNQNTRRLELLQYMKKTLVELCESHAGILLRSRCGSKVLREVYEHYPSRQLSEAIADATNSTTDDHLVSMFEDPIGHLCVKGILLNQAASSSANGDNSLSSALCTKYNGKLIGNIASSNRGAFVLAAMAEGNQEHVKKEVSLKDIKNIIQLCKKENKSVAGYEALLKAINK